jgi:3-hydroxybutyryl-CoA dehydratase
MARYFEDFVEGEEFEVGPRLVTQEDVNAFADVSGDHHPLHVDPEYAATTRFGRTIAHGVLGLAVATGLMGSAGLSRGTLVALRALDWEFRRPLFPGTEVGLRFRVAELRPSSRGPRGTVVWETELVDPDARILQRGRLTAIFRTRSAP